MKARKFVEQRGAVTFPTLAGHADQRAVRYDGDKREFGRQVGCRM